MLKKLKKNGQSLKEISKTIYEQNENSNEETETIFLKEQTNSGAERSNNWFEKFTRGVHQQAWNTKQRIGKYGDRPSGITEPEEQMKIKE